MKRIRREIVLKVRGPVLSKSSSIGAPGVDAMMARGVYLDDATGTTSERYYLAGSHVRGLLREAWQEIEAYDPRYGSAFVREWLGDESPEDSNDEPTRARLRFGDFFDPVTDPAQAEKDSRTRIKIDETTGAADSGMLQVMESPYAPGQQIEFRGMVSWLAGDNEDGTDIEGRILRGLSWARAAGGATSAGFGTIENVSMTKLDDESLAEPEPQPPPARRRLRLSFREPVLFARRRVADNWFASEATIPGGALKGAVATMTAHDAKAFAELRAELHLLRFSHAYPAKKDAEPARQWPLSLVRIEPEQKLEKSDDAGGENRFLDVVRRTAPPANLGMIAFDIDWKDSAWQCIRKLYGWPKFAHEVRVRTAIDSEVRKADEGDNGEGGKLFAWKMIRPHKAKPADKADDVEWVATLDTSELSDAAREQLDRLLRGLGLAPLGKSKAHAAVGYEDPPPDEVAEAEEYVVTLTTPCLLVAPNAHFAPNDGLGAADEAAIRDALAAAWDELSGGALRLRNYFQRCSLAGGGYFFSRFAKGAGAYKPYLLTDAGSTFLLEPAPGREAVALAKLSEWRRRGLELSASVCGFYEIGDNAATRWRTCPYLPENGYGEIEVNAELPEGIESHV